MRFRVQGVGVCGLRFGVREVSDNSEPQYGP